MGSDVVLTDTMRHADVILPACSHFEHDDLFAGLTGQHWLRRAERVIHRRGRRCRTPNLPTSRGRFGFTEPLFRATDAELMDDAIDGSDARLQGMRPSRNPTDRALLMTVDGEDTPCSSGTCSRAPSGKVELASAYLDVKYGQRLPGCRPYESPYPYILISPASDLRIASTFGGGGGNGADPAPPLAIHPDDARARGLGTGVPGPPSGTSCGEIHLPVKVTDQVPRGVVFTLKGTWLSTSNNGQTVSALCPSHHADIAEGACYDEPASRWPRPADDRG